MNNLEKIGIKNWSGSTKENVSHRRQAKRTLCLQKALLKEGMCGICASGMALFPLGLLGVNMRLCRFCVVLLNPELRIRIQISIILGSWIQIRIRVKNSRALEARMRESSNLSQEWSVDQWWQICSILTGSRIRIKVNSPIGILVSIQRNPDRL
jgi:hypothetical protein